MVGKVLLTEMTIAIIFAVLSVYLTGYNSIDI